jgi:hypothetical protein
MDAEALLATLKRHAFTVAVDGPDLMVKGPPSAMTPDLEWAIRDHKAELVELVDPDGWPPESLEAERRFGCWHARLYPFIGRTVSTLRGAGRLVQVFPERANVVLPGETQVGVFLPNKLCPPGGPRPSILSGAEKEHWSRAKRGRWSAW